MVIQRSRGETILSTYDRISISTGRIYTSYYGIEVYTGSADLTLVTNVIDSHIIEKRLAFVNGEMWDDDFDLEFVRTCRIGGKAVINITSFIKGTPSSSGLTLNIEVKLFRVDSASAEHQLGSTVTYANYSGSNNVHRVRRAAIKITIPTTKMKVGDKLRLSIKGTGNADSVNEKGGYCVDPSGRADASGITAGWPTTLIVTTPFIPDF